MCFPCQPPPDAWVLDASLHPSKTFLSVGKFFPGTSLCPQSHVGEDRDSCCHSGITHSTSILPIQSWGVIPLLPCLSCSVPPPFQVQLGVGEGCPYPLLTAGNRNTSVHFWYPICPLMSPPVLFQPQSLLGSRVTIWRATDEGDKAPSLRDPLQWVPSVCSGSGGGVMVICDLDGGGW